MFIRQGIVLAGIGVIVGSAAAVALSRLLSSEWFGISPLDPATYLTVSLVLIVAAVVASYVPVHRAAAVDPMTTLGGP